MKQHIRIYEDFINEGTVKTFETDVKSVIDHIKRGMGWIDPGYIEETWNELANSVDFSIAAAEVADRLIKAGLVYHEGDDGEKGKQVRSYREISSLVNEARFEADEIFFLWDETVDDDREGIESGHTDHRGKAATVFSFDTKDHKAFMDFKKKAAEYLKKQGLKHEDTGEQLFVYESSEAVSEAAFSVEDGIKVQSEQLAQWKKLLQPKVYKDLEKWATEHNDKAESGDQIIRGTDMDNFIGNYFNSYTPPNKR